MKASYRIVVSGRVQGVFFRQHAKDQADRLGLTGFVKNQPNGTVYIEVNGEQSKIEQFLTWCNDGSPSAQVEKVESTPVKKPDFIDFQIR